jgi:hypothetical protein
VRPLPILPPNPTEEDVREAWAALRAVYEPTMRSIAVSLAEVGEVMARCAPLLSKLRRAQASYVHSLYRHKKRGRW